MKETFKPEKLGISYIIGIVIVAFLLLSVPSIIKWTQYVWVYELAVLIGGAFAVSKIIRRNCSEYIYLLNDGILSVIIKTGMKEQPVCAFEVESIVEITSDSTAKQIKEKYGSVKVTRCNGSLFGYTGSQIIFKNGKIKEVLLFVPTAKMVEEIKIAINSPKSNNN